MIKPIKNYVNPTEIEVRTADVSLQAIITQPIGAKGLVLFVHGSGSSRFSPRNQFVAEILNKAGFATLLLDLLTPQENQRDALTREYRFDIDLLSRRTIATIDWLNEQTPLEKLSIGLFGASTGAAAALNAAAARPNEVECVVSRGGRPDLAMPKLSEVLAPTLLIVGSFDTEVLQLNQVAQQAIQAPCKIITIPGATHLFEEAGTLEQAAAAASDWFTQHLA